METPHLSHSKIARCSWQADSSSKTLGFDIGKTIGRELTSHELSYCGQGRLRNPTSPKGWLKPKQNNGKFTTVFNWRRILQPSTARELYYFALLRVLITQNREDLYQPSRLLGRDSMGEGYVWWLTRGLWIKGLPQLALWENGDNLSSGYEGAFWSVWGTHIPYMIPIWWGATWSYEQSFPTI